MGGLTKATPHLLLTQDLVLSSVSVSLGPSQFTLQPRHGHARSWLWTLLMHTLTLTHELDSQPAPGPALSPTDLLDDLGSGLAWLPPSSLLCFLQEHSRMGPPGPQILCGSQLPFSYSLFCCATPMFVAYFEF